MVDDDKAKESYLLARGWVRVERPIPWAEHWMLAWQEDRILSREAFPLDAAVARQLRWDAHGLVYFLETVNEQKPGTRQLIGGQVLMLVFGALKEFIKNKELMLEGARKLGEVMREAESDPGHQAHAAALQRAYELGKRAGGGGGSEGEKPN